MQWTPEAEKAIKKVPFFVRKRVRRRMEREVAEAGKSLVGAAEVKATQERYLNHLASEIQGYRLETCFGPGGCPNRAAQAENLVEGLERCLAAANLLDFLRGQAGDRLRLHHEFRVSVAECPNACSQPQIKDIGIIGIREPKLTDAACNGCGACEGICPDEAIKADAGTIAPAIDAGRCMACGKCIDACPTGTIAEGERGYRVLLGGKLGRHPKLAPALPGIFNEKEALDILTACIAFYKGHSLGRRRFAEILQPPDFQRLGDRFGKSQAHHTGGRMRC